MSRKTSPIQNKHGHTLPPPPPGFIRGIEQQPEDDSFNDSIQPFDCDTSIAASSTPIIPMSTGNVITHRKTVVTDYHYSPALAGNVNSFRSTDRHSSTTSSLNSTVVDDGRSFDDIIADYVEDVKYHYKHGGIMAVLSHFVVHILAAVCCILLLWLIYSIVYADTGRTTLEQFREYRTDLILLRKKYPKLTRNDMNTLKVIGQQWILDGGPNPVVLVVGGRSSADFLGELLRITSKARGSWNRSAFTVDSSTERAVLHNKVLHDLTDTSGATVSAISSIDSLSWDAPLVLHAFADADSFPVSNTLLILSTDFEISGSNICEDEIHEKLRDAWESLGGTSDNVTPILARLGYSICI